MDNHESVIANSKWWWSIYQILREMASRVNFARNRFMIILWANHRELESDNSSLVKTKKIDNFYNWYFSKDLKNFLQPTVNYVNFWKLFVCVLFWNKLFKQACGVVYVYLRVRERCWSTKFCFVGPNTNFLVFLSRTWPMQVPQDQKFPSAYQMRSTGQKPCHIVSNTLSTTSVITFQMKNFKSWHFSFIFWP